MSNSEHCCPAGARYFRQMLNEKQDVKAHVTKMIRRAYTRAADLAELERLKAHEANSKERYEQHTRECEG